VPHQPHQFKRRESRRRKRRGRHRRLRSVYYRLYIHGQPRGRHHKRNNRQTFYQYLNSIRSKTFVKHSEIIEFWVSRQAKIGPSPRTKPTDNVLRVPAVFSLSNEVHQAESFQFMRRLFDILYNQRVTNLRIDYERCEQIDIDAQVCMDVLLREFIRYFKDCDLHGVKRTFRVINPVSLNNEAIAKVLFSVGWFNLFNKIDLSFPDVLPHRLQIGDRRHQNSSERRDIEITKTVDYVVNCLNRMGKRLTKEAETQLYKVVGEVLINASEHATTNYRYSIGYFQEQPHDEEVLGILQLVIMNFGDTIYEKFKDPDCPNQDVVKRMQRLSETYTRKKWFFNAEFEEETLWTLYALQEGVTSHKNWRRGNGSIRFIDSFFGLKGDMEFDNLSSMTVLSGNTRIIFDGTYQIETKEITKDGKTQRFKVMPFNRLGDIEEQPDKKFVKFVPDYFPGTMISAKICIKPGNTAPIQQPNTSSHDRNN